MKKEVKGTSAVNSIGKVSLITVTSEVSSFPLLSEKRKNTKWKRSKAKGNRKSLCQARLSLILFIPPDHDPVRFVDVSQKELQKQIIIRKRIQERLERVGMTIRHFSQRLYIIYNLLVSWLSLLLVLWLAVRDTSFLVLLVFGNEIVHVGLSLSELHLVHTLTGVPMQESLAPEHGSELVANSLEELLDRSRVTNESGAHLQSTWWDGAECGLDVVWNPLNKVGRVLVLNVQHLVLNLLHADLSTEEGGAGEVSAVTEVRSGHHVLRVEHLLGKFWYGDGTEAVSATRSERGESDHEEVETREGNHVDGKLSQIGVQLTWET